MTTPNPDPTSCVRALCAIAGSNPPRLLWRLLQGAVIAALHVTLLVLKARKA